MDLRRRAADAYRQRRWRPFLILAGLALFFLVGTELVKARLASWANQQIDTKAPEVVSWVEVFLSSPWFSITIWLFSSLIVIILFLVVFFRVTRLTIVPVNPVPDSEGAPLSYAERRKTIDGLGYLFATGVKYRNGEVVPTESELKSWESDCENHIRPLSISHLHEFRTLDLFRPRVRGPKRIEVIDGKLQVLRRVMREHDPDLQHSTAEARPETDAPRIAVPQLFFRSLNYRLGMSGQADFEGLGIPDGRRVAKVSSIVVATGPILMEQFRLEVAGEELPALRAHTIDTLGETMGASWNFEVPTTIPFGNHMARFLVLGAGQWWSSDPFNMDVTWDLKTSADS